MGSGRKITGAIRSLVNAKVLRLECVGALHETLLLLVMFYGSKTMAWRENDVEIRDDQMDRLRDLLGILGIRRMDRLPNAQIRDVWSVEEGE